MEWTQSLLVLLCVMSAGSCHGACLDNIPSECEATDVRFKSDNITSLSPLCNFWTLKVLSRNTSTMTSKLLCNSERQQLCLSFKFIFQSGFLKALSILLNSLSSQSVMIWSITNETSYSTWNDARVPIQTNTHFYIVFQSRIAGRYIDVTKMKIEQKHCTIAPPSAAANITKSTPIIEQNGINAVTTGKDFKTESTTSKLDAKETDLLVAIIAPVATVTLIFVLISLLLFILFKKGKLTYIRNKFSHNTKPCQETKRAREPVSQSSAGITSKDNAVCNDVAKIRNGPTSTLLEREDCYSSINEHTSLTHPDEALDIVYHNVNNNPTLQNPTTHDVYSVVDKSNQCQGLQNQTHTDVYPQVKKTGRPQEENTTVYANSATKETVKQPTQEVTLQDVYAVVNKPTLSAGKSPAEEHPVSQDVYACVNKSSA